MLRNYQATAVEGVLHALTTNGSAVLQMPTGAGKTKAATEIIKRHDKPVWFICHRQEIERQAAKAFTAAGIDFGIVSPRAKPDYDKQVQIVSVTTLMRRIKDMPLPSLAIWDECHHVAAKSWARIREQLTDSQNLGLTATPERLDGKGLSEWFDALVCGPSTRELIDAGWLSDFRYFAPSEPDLKGARLQAGDYAKKDLAKVMNTPVLIGDAIVEYQKNAAGKRALVFCAGVEASKELVARFNADGVPARHVDGNTPTDERDAAVEALASGEIKVLSNVEVFTEGFDLPAIDAVILLRPTKSLALFLQMIGRVLRKAEGKDGALIFDHAGLWLDHDWFDLPVSWSLEGGARQRRLAGRKVGPRRCPECREVRPARVEVCACGYEFPTGREIGEYDGVLRELRGVVPEGCVTKAEFARLCGVSKTCVGEWVTRGLPIEGAYIPRRNGVLWVNENAPQCPEGCETKAAFARRYGVSENVVRGWSKRGLPMETAYVSIVNGCRWVESNAPPCPVNHLGKKDFAARHGFSKNAAENWIRRGLPHENGHIPIDDGDEWVRDNVFVSPAGYVSGTQFAKQYGVTLGAVRSWFLRGLPNLRGKVHKDNGSSWVAENIDFHVVEQRKAQLTPMNGYDKQKDFAVRVGRSRSSITLWLRRGLPHNEVGHIHIQRGLEWVRDNTSIIISPEAWPVANDNHGKRRAA